MNNSVYSCVDALVFVLSASVAVFRQRVVNMLHVCFSDQHNLCVYLQGLCLMHTCKLKLGDKVACWGAFVKSVLISDLGPYGLWPNDANSHTSGMWVCILWPRGPKSYTSTHTRFNLYMMCIIVHIAACAVAHRLIRILLVWILIVVCSLCKMQVYLCLVLHIHIILLSYSFSFFSIVIPIAFSLGPTALDLLQSFGCW